MPDLLREVRWLAGRLRHTTPAGTEARYYAARLEAAVERLAERLEARGEAPGIETNGAPRMGPP